MSKWEVDLTEEVEKRTKELLKTNSTLKKYIAKLESDHAAGQRMQYRLLPMRKMIFGKYEFSRYLLPSMYLSGDFLDYYELDDNTLLFYILDVSGHGISSAFITVIVKNLIDIHAQRYRLENNRLILDPVEFLKKVNTELLREDIGKYLTIFFGMIKKKENKLIYVNCGQFPNPIIYNGTKNTILSGKGTPIGLFKSLNIEQKEFTLPEDFSLLFISDGILEILEQPALDEKIDYLKSLQVNIDIEIGDIMKENNLDAARDLPDDVTFLMIKRRNN